jgi:hypothetical protein
MILLTFTERQVGLCVSIFMPTHLHIKPLLPLLSGDGRFYILALSQKEVRLLEGSRYGIDAVELEKVPRGLAAALKFDVRERQLQFHAGMVYAVKPTQVPGGAPIAAIFRH